MQNSILVLLEGSWIVSLFFFPSCFQRLVHLKDRVTKSKRRRDLLSIPSQVTTVRMSLVDIRSMKSHVVLSHEWLRLGHLCDLSQTQQKRAGLEAEQLCFQQVFTWAQASPWWFTTLHSKAGPFTVLFFGAFFLFVCLFGWFFFSFYFYQVAEFELLKWSARLYFLTW